MDAVRYGEAGNLVEVYQRFGGTTATPTAAAIYAHK